MRRLLLALAACLVVTPGLSEAQVTDMLPSDGPFALEVHKPFFDGGDGFGFLTSAALVRVLAPVGEGLFFSGDIGLSFATADGESSGATSNPEIGLLIVDDDELPRGRISIMLPFSADWGDDDFAVGTGVLMFPERIDRFLPDTWSVNGAFTPTRKTESGMFGFEIGGSLMGSEGVDTEFFGRYGAFATTASGGASFGAEVSGEVVISEGDLSFSERTLHQLTLSVGPVEPSAVPRIFVRIPLDGDVNDFLNMVVGARVSF